MSNLVKAIKNLEHIVEANGISTDETLMGVYDCLPMVIAIKSGGQPRNINCGLLKCDECPLALTRGWKDLINETKLEELLDD